MKMLNFFREILSRIALFENPQNFTNIQQNGVQQSYMYQTNPDDTVSTIYAVDLFFLLHVHIRSLDFSVLKFKFHLLQ